MSYREHPIRLVSGRTCLDFINTANWSADGRVVQEKLVGDKDVDLWCRAAGLKDVIGRSGRLADIRVFRGSLRTIFLAAINSVGPRSGDLSALNDALASIPNPALCTSSQTAFRVGPSITLDQAIAISAMAVLSSESEISRVKTCAGNNCAWLFLDESRNRRRRWCSMRTCGNREKARRHYQRKSA